VNNDSTIIIDQESSPYSQLKDMKSQVNLNYHKATVLVGKLQLNKESRNINVKASTSDGSNNKQK
jgi:hypothetical protein